MAVINIPDELEKIGSIERLLLQVRYECQFLSHQDIDTNILIAKLLNRLTERERYLRDFSNEANTANMTLSQK